MLRRQGRQMVLHRNRLRSIHSDPNMLLVKRCTKHGTAPCSCTLPLWYIYNITPCSPLTNCACIDHRCSRSDLRCCSALSDVLCRDRLRGYTESRNGQVRGGQAHSCRGCEAYQGPLQRGQVRLPSLVIRAATKVYQRPPRREQSGVLQGEEHLE
jgi:hypothetical protein